MRTQYSKRGTKYKTKTGVEVDETEAQLDILVAAARVYEDTPQDLIVTSGNEGYEGDGVHMKGSEHYPDQGSDALDLRIWNLEDPGAVADKIAELLGQEFDVVYGPSHDTHIHIEYDP